MQHRQANGNGSDLNSSRGSQNSKSRTLSDPNNEYADFEQDAQFDYARDTNR
jgi:hypothetical protein